MTLKNNIEAIIIKWAYQIDEVLSRDSDEELNIPGTVKPWYSGPWNSGIPWNSGQNCAYRFFVK